ncbi:efflux RND transporter periplasmic adaptor subunit [Desulfovibrio sp. JY]|nr:efflux RND transporter periplasmic adaptor subunit [Desulfovibrio sp. JY]
MSVDADRKPKFRTLAIALGVVFLVAFALGYLLRGSGRSPTTPPTPTDAVPATTPAAGHDHGEGTGQKAVEWTCVMHPWIRLPKPGKCPICGMDLVPAHKSETGSGVAASLRQVTLSPSALALAQVETVPVRRLGVDVDTRLFGKVAYDESTMATITAWVPGRLDKLYVDQTGVTVAKGQKMAEIYSPELLAAQSELVEAGKASARFGSSDNAAIREAAAATERAAREKLRLLGLSPAQIAAAVSRGAPMDHVLLTAPVGGVVVRKDVVEGAYVATGARLFSIADLRTVWVELDAYEKDLPWVHVGDVARFEAEALPGRVFTGKVVFIDPFLNNTTRTVRVRLEVPNPDGALKPGMLVHGLQQTPAARGQQPLVIPESAPLVTGKRAVVYVADPGKEGVFTGREVVLGPRAGAYYVVQNGLPEGERVVTRGSFMIDSAAQIEAKPSMMNPEGGAAGGMQPAQGEAKAAATVVPAFLEQLAPVGAAYDALGKATASGDLAKAKEAFGDFKQAVLEVDPRSLTGPAAGMWSELSMLLGNDAVVGGESVSLDEVKRRLAELAADWKRTMDMFPLPMTHGATKASGTTQENVSSTGTPPPPLPAAAPQAPKAVIEAPPAFRKAFDTVMAAYTKLQLALARNDLVKSRAAVQELGKAVPAVPMEALSGDAHKAWMADKTDIDAGLAEMAKAKDLEGVRKGFKPFSKGLTQALAHLGAAKGPYFEIYCPMAFDGQGATWISPDKTVKNPYLGPEMGDCGEVKGQIAPGK